VRLLTYNIFVRPLVNDGESDYKAERLKIFCETQFSNFDIICFQELFNHLNHFTTDLIDAANKAGFKYYCVATPPSLFSWSTADAGLTILSRFPIVLNKFYPFKEAPVGADILC
jgi:hypothetical protein